MESRRNTLHLSILNSMGNIITKSIFLVFFITLFLCIEANAEYSQKWLARLGDGTDLDIVELANILKAHEVWSNSIKKKGRCADFKNATFHNVDFSNAILVGADFSDSTLYKCNFSNAKLSDANFSNANMLRSVLNESVASHRFLINNNSWNWEPPGTVLEPEAYAANFTGANLYGATIKNADFSGANLKKVRLLNANIAESDFSFANLDGTIFEPLNLPDMYSMIFARNLSKLTFIVSPQALSKMRGHFKSSGLRKQQRKITYAIKHSQIINSLNEGSRINKAEAIANWIFFDVTSKWGMSPARPFWVILIFILFFSLFYVASILSETKTDGIWKVWIADRVRTDLGNRNPKLLLKYDFPKAALYGMYFSILSAFHVGWRDLNIGSWIARMQPKEYTLKSSGWVRFLSGFQSLISVYLFALMVLCYFSDPFDYF